MTRSYGKKYDKNKSTKTIAAEVRREVRLASRLGVLPEGQWSVTSDRCSRSSSITIAYEPPPERDEAFALAFYYRRRIEALAENPHRHFDGPWRSAFGQEFVRRLEGLLADHNHDGSDSSTDYYDVKFYGNVTVRTRTTEADLVELLRGGCWPADRKLSDIDPKLAQMQAGWVIDALVEGATPPGSTLVESLLIGGSAQGGKTAAWEARQRSLRTSPLETDPGLQRSHLRLVKPEDIGEAVTLVPVEPVEQLLAANAASRGGTGVLEGLRPPRPGARRRSFAVPVEELPPVNEAWARLALATELALDWEIPGLRELLATNDEGAPCRS